MSRYALVDVGCLHCHIGTEILAVFNSVEAAEQRVEEFLAELQEDPDPNVLVDVVSWRYFKDGQHDLQVCELPDAD